MTAKDIKKEIRAAILQFGEYNFFDKGLYETMDTGKIKQALVAMDAAKCADTLEGVLKLDKKYGGRFVQGMLMELDDQEEEFWDGLMEREALADLY